MKSLIHEWIQNSCRVLGGGGTIADEACWEEVDHYRHAISVTAPPSFLSAMTEVILPCPPCRGGLKPLLS